MLIDACLPRWDERAAYATRVAATAAEVDAALVRTDFARSRTISTLLALRGLPHAHVTIDALERFGFTRLGHRPGEELLLGLVGRFWTARGGVIRIAPHEFAAFDRPGYARAAWNFTMTRDPGGACVLGTETRVLCTDDAARRRFLRYWRIVGPFSGLIRRRMLRAVRATAERHRGGL